MHKLVTVLILFPEVAHEMSALGKQEVPHTCSKHHRQEEPGIERHDNQHEDVGIAHLYHMEQ